MEFTEPTGAQLIERARQGDRSAQSMLWQAHRRWVAAIVIAHRPRSVDVDDLMQEVAVKLIDKLETLRDARAFKPWLRRIAINACRGAARTSRPMLSIGSGGGEGAEQHNGTASPPSPEATSQESVETRDYAERLLALLMTLPPEYREPMILRCVRSLSYSEICDILDLPLTTIETRLARARRMLREEMEMDEEPDKSAALQARHPAVKGQGKSPAGDGR